MRKRPMPGSDRRLECRYVAEARCVLRFKNRLGVVETEGWLADLSVRGARIALPREFPIANIVAVTLPQLAHHPLYGKIVHAARPGLQRPGFLGLRIVEGTLPFNVFSALIGDILAKREDEVVPECLKHLGLTFPVGANDVHTAFRERARYAHPDHGGSDTEFIRIYNAYQEALKLCS